MTKSGRIQRAPNVHDKMARVHPQIHPWLSVPEIYIIPTACVDGWLADTWKYDKETYMYTNLHMEKYIKARWCHVGSACMLSKFTGPVRQLDIFYECPKKNVRVPDQMSDRNKTISVWWMKRSKTHKGQQLGVMSSCCFCMHFWGYAGNRTRVFRSTVQPATSAPPRRASGSTFFSNMPYLNTEIPWNKRPKRPHIVHLSTICHLFEKSAKADIFVYWSARKIKLCRGHWDLASCQVSLNSVQRFQRSRKCLSQSKARAAILFFRSARKTQTW